ncbi:MAG: hypothetical protein V3T55_12070 [Anaerolineales bacterium]
MEIALLVHFTLLSEASVYGFEIAESIMCLTGTELDFTEEFETPIFVYIRQLFVGGFKKNLKNLSRDSEFYHPDGRSGNTCELAEVMSGSGFGF